MHSSSILVTGFQCPDTLTHNLMGYSKVYTDITLYIISNVA